MIKKYIKKPVEIEAVQWTGDNTKEIKDFVEPIAEYLEDENVIVIPTLEGEMKASINDYIIKGVKGEFYPCKQDIFEDTYYLSNKEPEVLSEVGTIKQLRKDIDDILQGVRLLNPCREASICITKLQEAIMWLGMDLKRLREPNPYPESMNPNSDKIEPTADGLKM